MATFVETQPTETQEQANVTESPCVKCGMATTLAAGAVTRGHGLQRECHKHTQEWPMEFGSEEYGDIDGEFQEAADHDLGQEDVKGYDPKEIEAKGESKDDDVFGKVWTAPLLTIKIDDIVGSEQKAETKVALPTLALEDRKEELALGSVMETKAASEAQPSGEGAVVQTLQALQRQLGDKPESNAKKPKAKVTKKGLKKPASCTKMNGPASKAASKKPAAAMRRAAAAASSSRRTESREEWRLRIINAFVPLSLQRQYRNGCAKCYHRAGCTLSCWKLRGFPMTD
eukprot:s792_g35.t1